MNPIRVGVRSLIHFRSGNAMATIGIAVATMVVVGALIVGDSIRGTLKDKALHRLGRVDHALVSPRWFSAPTGVEGIVLLNGSAASETNVVLPKVQVVGVSASSASLVGVGGVPEPDKVWLNERAATALGVKVGDGLFVNLPSSSSGSIGTLFERKSLRDTRTTVRVEVSKIVTCDFSLASSGPEPLNLFVDRDWVASALNKKNKANALVASGEEPRLELKAADLGLTVKSSKSGYAIVETDRMMFTDEEVAKLTALGDAKLTSTQLATKFKCKGREATYSVVAYLPETAPKADDGISLNAWLADDLGAKIGDKLALDYLVPKADGSYDTATLNLVVESILPLKGFGADPDLTPNFEGISDAARINDWKAPFPIDMNRVSPRDDVYWTRYHAAPKAFLSESVIKKMWGDGASGWVTGVRFAKAPKLKGWDPASRGMSMKPVRALALKAAQGSTEFTSLFLGLGMFVIFAGIGLTSTTLRLGLQARTSQIGMLSACGWRPFQIRLALLVEAFAVAVVGSLVGVALGIGFAYWMISALSTWLGGAVGGLGISTHLESASVVGGWIGGVVLGLGVAHFAVGSILKRPVVKLIQAGSAEQPKSPKTRGLSIWIAGFLIVAAIAMAQNALSHRQGSPATTCFVAGALLLIASILGLSAILSPKVGSTLTPRLLSLRNAATNKRQSLLAFGLLASASFVLVAVAANGKDVTRLDPTDKASGTGGFSLIAESSMPISVDFGTAEGRARLMFKADDEQAFAGVKIVPFMMSQGDDTSCSNPAKPTMPRFLGVTNAMTERGGFTVTTSKPSPTPWQELTPNKEPISAFGDSETLTWMFETHLGGTLKAPISNDKTVELKVKGLVASSILSGGLLIADKDFKSLFPGQEGNRFFLIETPKGKENEVAQALRRNLGEAGLDVREARQALNEVTGVQNAYLAAFLALGGLGLILGTVGLAASVLRSASERKKEFALLTAQGFETEALRKMLLTEYAALLLGGVLAGTVSALVAVLPTITASDSKVNWAAVVFVLVLALAVGLAACAMSARFALRGRLIDALRSE